MVTPYITFAGNCREALSFYQTVFDSEIQMQQTYGDYVPESVTNPPDDLDDWILHAEMKICDTIFWFADEIAEPVTKGSMVKLTITIQSAKEAKKIFDSLNYGAHITLPEAVTFYSAFHAALTDKYGVNWNIVALETPDK